MVLIRRPNEEALATRAPDERYNEELTGHSLGNPTCMIAYIVTPPGSGSPAGLHVHDFDQTFYILEGVMQIEMEGERHAVAAGSIVVFPKSVPHRNWNEGPSDTIHLAINTPAPDTTQPISRPV